MSVTSVCQNGSRTEDNMRTFINMSRLSLLLTQRGPSIDTDSDTSDNAATSAVFRITGRCSGTNESLARASIVL